MPPNQRLLREETLALRQAPLILNHEQRRVVEDAIQEVCEIRDYELPAVNARSNHVPAVVSATQKPEHVLNALKSYATRKLRQTNLVHESITPRARHGSTPYLWTVEELQRAIDYVINGQDDEPFR
jgi:REP element-mobilizing transposase RayT